MSTSTERCIRLVRLPRCSGLAPDQLGCHCCFPARRRDLSPAQLMNDHGLIPGANGAPVDAAAQGVSPLRRNEREMTSPNTATATQATNRPRQRRIKRSIALAVSAVVLVGAAAAIIVTRPWAPTTGPSVQSVRYLGLYEPDAPASYTGVDRFAQAIGRATEHRVRRQSVAQAVSGRFRPFGRGPRRDDARADGPDQCALGQDRSRPVRRLPALLTPPRSRTSAGTSSCPSATR